MKLGWTMHVIFIRYIYYKMYKQVYMIAGGGNVRGRRFTDSVVPLQRIGLLDTLDLACKGQFPHPISPQ